MLVKTCVLMLLCAVWPLWAQTTTNHHDTLKNARWFALAGGIADMPTPENYALAAICEQTNAVETLQRLLKEPGATPQLYAALGLRLVGAPEFKAALAPLLDSKETVLVMTGCIVGPRSVAEAARQVRDTPYQIRSMPAAGGRSLPTVVEEYESKRR